MISREATSDFNFQLSKFQLYSKTPAVTYSGGFCFSVDFLAPLRLCESSFFYHAKPPSACGGRKDFQDWMRGHAAQRRQCRISF
jgi:hypothetical protein